MLVFLCFFVTCVGSMQSDFTMEVSAPTHSTNSIHNNISNTPLTLSDIPALSSPSPEAPPASPQSPPKKKRKYEKPPTEKKIFKCTHLSCQHGIYGDEPACYTTRQQLEKHERNGDEHPCAGGKKCDTCRKYRNEETFNEPHKGYFSCRHTYCLAKLKSKSALSQHEKNLNIHQQEKCGVKCHACARQVRNEAHRQQEEKQKQQCAASCCVANRDIQKENKRILAKKLREMADELEKDNETITKGYIPKDGWFIVRNEGKNQQKDIMTVEEYLSKYTKTTDKTKDESVPGTKKCLILFVFFSVDLFLLTF